MGNLLLRRKTTWRLSLAALLVIAVAQPLTATDPVRGGHKVTKLADGTVLVTGGHDSEAYLTSAEIYDPATGNLTPTGSMATARQLHTATLLADGTVLVVGGFGGAGLFLASAELYDPASGTFFPTGSLATARGGHTATRRDEGTVLVVGGLTATFPASAEIYDPATGSWR